MILVIRTDREYLLLLKINKMGKNPKIFMLHRVLNEYDEGDYYFQRETAISWKKFIELLDFIEMKGWKTKPISSLGEGCTDNDAYITFDDGYMDNARALDELIGRGMTATIYPVKDFVQNKFSPIDDMAHYLMSTENVTNTLRHSLLVGRIKKILRWTSSSTYRRLRGSLFGIETDFEHTQMFMSEQALKCYCEKGIELGIHGVSHRAFTLLSPHTLKYELIESLAWIRALGAEHQVSICFPHGKHNKQVIQECSNISSIFLGVDTNQTHPLVYRRIHVTEGYSE